MLHDRHFVISDQDFGDGGVFKNVDTEIEGDCIANKLIEGSWCILLSVILSILFLQIRLKIIPIFINIIIKEFDDALNWLDTIVRKSISFLKVDESSILVFNISSI